MADTVTLPAQGTGSNTPVISTREVSVINEESVTPQHIERIVISYPDGEGIAVDSAGDATYGLDVDVTRSALPTGAATETTLSSIESDTGALAGTVSGTELQVDIVASLPAGNNNIGDVDVASVTGNVTVVNGGTFPVQVSSALPAGNNNIGDVDVASLPSIPAGNNNIGDVDIASALPAGNNNIGDVDIASALPAGTNNIGDVDVLTLPSIPAGNNNIGDVDVASLPSIPAGNNNIGDVDVASIAAGNNNIGNVDVESQTPISRTGLVTTRVNYTAAQTDTAIVSTTSGVIHVTSIQIGLDAACTVAVAVRIGFGSANTPTGDGVLASHPGIVPGGGMVKGDGSADMGYGASGDDLRITSTVPTGGSIDVVISYYIV